MRHARDDYNRIQDPAGLIPDGEPVFLIRGQDNVAPFVVRNWAKLAELAGADAEIIQRALHQADRMDAWQAEHGRKVADLPPSHPSPTGRAAGGEGENDAANQ